VILAESTAGALFGKDEELLEDGRLLVLRTDPLVLAATRRDYSNGGIPPDSPTLSSQWAEITNWSLSQRGRNP